MDAGDERPPLAGVEVAVVGGSVSGLAAAIALLDKGADVQLYERTPVELQRRGGGLFLQESAHEALRERNIPLTGCPIHTWRRVTAEGARERPWENEALTWDYVWRTFRSHVPDDRYRSGHALSALEPNETRPRAAFSNGAEVTADLIVVADGAGSTGRSLLTGTTPTYAGYVAWRGSTPLDAVSAEIQQRLVGKVTELVGNENNFGVYAVAGDPHSRETSTPTHFDWAWAINAPESALPALLGERFARSGLLPPGALDPAVERWLHSLADELLPDELARIVKATQTPYARTVVDHPADRLVWPGVALVGDAAGPPRYHTGGATSKAIGDGFSLTDTLVDARLAGRSLLSALRDWEMARRPVATKLGRQGRNRGKKIGLGQSDWGPATPFRHTGLTRGRDGRFRRGITSG